ncbi:MAG: sugar transferase [Patescibacteria group bacterium]|jgi:exopolysaccharide biosynthesis polyprenyl glycosylphosphotransferase
MKRIELIIAGILVPLDYCLVVLSGWLSYNSRFLNFVTGIRAVQYPLPYTDFIKLLFISAFLMVVIFAWNGMYETTGTRRIVDELRKIVLASSTGILIIMIVLFFNRDLFSSRYIILLTWIISIVLVSGARLVVILVERALFKRGIGVHRVLLLGASRSAAILDKAFRTSPTLGYVVVERAQHLSTDIVEKLKKIVRVKQIDEIIVADQDLSRQQIVQLIDFSKTHHLAFKYAADIFDSKLSHVVMRPVADIPLMELQRTPLQGWGKIFKRTIDVIFSLLALLVFGPIMLLTALAVKLDSPGNVIYRNRRVGEQGKLFDTLKFRSMKQEYCIGEQYSHNAEALDLEKKLIAEQSIKAGPVYKIKDDPRVTRVGRIIRQLSLDEFPQFINVLKGEMSVVGPRPHQPREVEKYADAQKSILSMKPGVTGMAQISGRSDLEFIDEIRLDTYYMENWSIILDLYIIFKTPFILLQKRKAL